MESSERDGIPEHPTCLLRNLYTGHEATVRTGCGTRDWFQIGKGVRQGCVLLRCLFNFPREGNGNPLQYPCLENSMDGGAWQAIYSSNCCFLTCIQISQKASKAVWYSYIFKNFPQFVVIHTIKGFGIVNKAEVDVFLELSCFPYDPTDVGNLTSGSSVFSKSSSNIWKFLVHVPLNPGLENFEYYPASV